MIVEDEDALRRLMAGVFRRKGYDVLVAETPDDALPLFEQHASALKLVIADVIMPGMSGPMLVEKFREERPDLPAIFISGYTDDRVDPHALVGGNTAFFQKPFELLQLEMKVIEMLAPLSES